MLVPGGKLSQTIAYSEPNTLHPVLEKTFPESDLPLMWEPIAAAETHFRLIAARNDPEHYYRTLQLWKRNLAKRHHDAANLVGDDAVAEFRRYLQVSCDRVQDRHHRPDEDKFC